MFHSHKESSLLAGLVPSPVRTTCQWLRKNALGEEGLFRFEHSSAQYSSLWLAGRIPGSRRKVKELVNGMNSDSMFQIAADESAANVTSLLVNFVMGTNKAGTPLWGNQQSQLSSARTCEAVREVWQYIAWHRQSS